VARSRLEKARKPERPRSPTPVVCTVLTADEGAQPQVVFEIKDFVGRQISEADKRRLAVSTAEAEGKLGYTWPQCYRLLPSDLPKLKRTT